MTRASGSSEPPPKHGKWFDTTHWSLVETARDSGNPGYAEALATLCEAYWPPVYSYLRYRGSGIEEARDLTQGFFAELLERKRLRSVRRAKGRFRSFLLASVKHYVTNEWDRARAQKRGGEHPLIQFEFDRVEKLGGFGSVDSRDPEKLYEQKWASTMFERVFVRLQGDMKQGNDARRFQRLKLFLTDPVLTADSYKNAAADLDMTEGAVKVAVHRLRRRFAAVLREEIAHTVTNPFAIDEEIRFLFAALDP